jgi:hypothetical protein
MQDTADRAFILKEDLHLNGLLQLAVMQMLTLADKQHGQVLKH